MHDGMSLDAYMTNTEAPTATEINSWKAAEDAMDDAIDAWHAAGKPADGLAAVKAAEAAYLKARWGYRYDS